MIRTNVHRPKESLLFAGGIFFSWILLILTGMYHLMSYEYSPGIDRNFPHSWPLAAKIKRASNGYTLIMTVHPKCSCSSASLGELAKLMARFSGELQAKILFVIPKNAQGNWTESQNWNAANIIPRVEALLDSDGLTAKLFHAQTSGLTLLYNEKGKLVFSGGITASRGHWGDNLGSKTIAELITRGTSEVSSTSVFGCRLFNNSRA